VTLPLFFAFFRLHNPKKVNCETTDAIRPPAQHNGEKKGHRHFIRAVKALDAALLYCNPGTNLRFALTPLPLMHLSRRLATISRNFCDLLPSLPFQIFLGMLGVLLEDHGTVYTVLLMRIAGYHFYKITP